MNTLDRLLQISDLFSKDMARAFAGTGLTQARVQVLWAIVQAGPSNQRDLASACDVTPRNITALVDALEASGHVVRAPHPTDRRAVLVSLTPTAEVIMTKMARDHEELANSLVDAIAPADRAAVDRGMAAIAERLALLIREEQAAASPSDAVA